MVFTEDGFLLGCPKSYIKHTSFMPSGFEAWSCCWFAIGENKGCAEKMNHNGTHDPTRKEVKTEFQTNHPSDQPGMQIQIRERREQ
jgi:hypothetical protein